MKKIVIGGTFDLLHKGHQHILSFALSLGKVKVGLTSDEMALKNKGEGVQRYEVRKENILMFSEKIEVEKIEDPVGFAIYEDFDFIIVSPETRTRAEKINKERLDIGKKEIEIKEVDFIFAEDGEPISSTRIRSGEIDREGNIIKK